MIRRPASRFDARRGRPESAHIQVSKTLAEDVRRVPDEPPTPLLGRRPQSVPAEAGTVSLAVNGRGGQQPCRRRHAALWIDGQEGHIPHVPRGVDRDQPGFFVSHELHRHAKAPPQLARLFSRDAARLPRGGVPRGQHEVAEVDGGAQRACGASSWAASGCVAVAIEASSAAQASIKLTNILIKPLPTPCPPPDSTHFLSATCGPGTLLAVAPAGAFRTGPPGQPGASRPLPSTKRRSQSAARPPSSGCSRDSSAGPASGP